MVLGGLREWFKDKERAMNKYFVVLMTVVLIALCGCKKVTNRQSDNSPKCSRSAQCNDGNNCTADSCNSGVCIHTPITGCAVCVTHAQCDDGNVCTSDQCVNGVCRHTGISGCAACTKDADCKDNNVCTSDQCVNGVCKYTFIAGCFP